MPTVAGIVASLAERTRPSLAPAWDPVGLQLGDPSATVESVGVCHEVTEAVVAAVEASPVDLLVTYHPLLFEPVNRILAGRSPEARAFRLLGAHVSLLVIHTDFDAAPGGTADALAAAVGLADVGSFGEEVESGTPAIGRVGRFEGTVESLEARVVQALGARTIRVSGERSAQVGRVAVLPGSGGVFIDQASAIADALVTGDVSHHRAVHALDLGLFVIDPGHVATERPGMVALVGMVADVTGGRVVDLTHLDPETWS